MAINYQGGNDVVVTGAFAPMMKTLQQNYLYEQEKREQERKELNAVKAETQKQLAKINPNGIWEGDAKLVGKTYDEIKELNFQMEKARTPEEKRMKSLEIQGKATELTNLIANSKEFKKGWLDQYNRVPTQIGKMDTSKAVSYLDSAKGKSSSELGSDYLTGVNNFFYKFDETKEMAEFRRQASAFVKNSSNFTTDDSGLKSVTRGQRTYQEGVVKYLPNEAKILEITSNFFKSSPERENMLSTYMERNQITDRNQAIAKFATENGDLFTKPDKEERINTSKGGITLNVDNRVMTPSEQISTRPLQVGKFTSPSSITRNEKGVLLSGNKEFYDPNTGQKIKVGRDNFQVDYTQDVRLGVDKNGNPVDENSPQAVGVQNFAVAQMVDPSVSSIQANIPEYANIGKRTVLIPEGDRQLFGKSKTVKTDAERRSQQNTSNKQNSNTNKQKTPAELMREARGNK